MRYAIFAKRRENEHIYNDIRFRVLLDYFGSSTFRPNWLRFFRHTKAPFCHFPFHSWASLLIWREKMSPFSWDCVRFYGLDTLCVFNLSVVTLPPVSWLSCMCYFWCSSRDDHISHHVTGNKNYWKWKKIYTDFLHEQWSCLFGIVLKFLLFYSSLNTSATLFCWLFGM